MPISCCWPKEMEPDGGHLSWKSDWQREESESCDLFICRSSNTSTASVFSPLFVLFLSVSLSFPLTLFWKLEECYTSAVWWKFVCVCVSVSVYVRWCLFLSVFACLLCVFALKWERVEAGLSGGRGLSMCVWNSGRPVSFFFHPPPPTCRAHAYFIEVVVCVASRRAAGSNQ